MTTQIRKKKENSAVQRLKKDYLRLMKDPIPYINALPLSKNILEWHYVIEGPENTPYEKGIYHGVLKFPAEFPFRPPTIIMLTPNGRFKTNTKLCFSISDFHPETWNPAWSVSTILTGVLSYMVDNLPTYGSIETTDKEKKKLAYASLTFNLENETFCELFPDLVNESKLRLKNCNNFKKFSNESQTQKSSNFSSDKKKINLENILISFFIFFSIVLVAFLLKYLIS